MLLCLTNAINVSRCRMDCRFARWASDSFFCSSSVSSSESSPPGTICSFAAPSEPITALPRLIRDESRDVERPNAAACARLFCCAPRLFLWPPSVPAAPGALDRSIALGPARKLCPNEDAVLRFLKLFAPANCVAPIDRLLLPRMRLGSSPVLWRSRDRSRSAEVDGPVWNMRRSRTSSINPPVPGGSWLSSRSGNACLSMSSSSSARPAELLASFLLEG
mmetsp:Transcript_3952/g.6916  ORF Transcript_3952/g.6916 Transcript_3952/m.6916 type:complete len:220 (-) Transcript_3952:1226-1885(-)